MRDPLITREVELLVKKKTEAYIRLRKLGSDWSLEGYMLAWKELKRGLRRASKGHEKTLAGKPQGFLHLREE